MDRLDAPMCQKHTHPIVNPRLQRKFTRPPGPKLDDYAKLVSKHIGSPIASAAIPGAAGISASIACTSVARTTVA